MNRGLDNMKQFAAVSVLGKDRPGIVAAVTKVLFETGCNIEDSTMTMLSSEFAMILLVALPGKLTLKLLSAKFSSLAKSGLSVSLRALKPSEEVKVCAKGSPYMISVYGSDKPGIVYQISKYLSLKDINITDVQTSISSVGEKNTYIMLLEVDIPEKAAPEQIRIELLKVAESLGVSVSINPVDSPSL
jgi:glycine cleavage system transcriptional repressor